MVLLINNVFVPNGQISNYMNRISGPLLDRIDIHVEVKPVPFDDLSNSLAEEPSSKIKERVNKARLIQQNRYKGLGIHSNAMLNSKHIKEFCILDDESKNLLKMAFSKLGFSARAHDRIIKLARTIADLEGNEDIKSNHIAEAINYRSLDRKYFK